MKAITDAVLYIDGHFVKDHYIAFEERILEIAEMSNFDHMRFEECRTLPEHYLIPGFIDVHIHGCGSFDTMDSTKETLEQLSKTVIRYGVTSFLPTTITAPLPDLKKSLENIRNYLKNQPLGGARVLGAHLEGPFLNKQYCGAQPEEYILLPEKRLLEEYRDVIKVITIAPEMNGAMDLIKTFGSDMRFSLGHSGCDYDTAMRAFRSGAKSVTHLFNAMSRLHHRSPGLVGAALKDRMSYAELIADGIHIHPDLFDPIIRCKGTDRILLITDCMRAGGLHDGMYELGGQKVKVERQTCLLEDGTIAGSVLTMDEAYRNILKYSEISPEDALRMTAPNQADYLGEKKYGRLSVGACADFAVLNATFQVTETIVGGTSVWKDTPAYPTSR